MQFTMTTVRWKYTPAERVRLERLGFLFGTPDARGMARIDEIPVVRDVDSLEDLLTLCEDVGGHIILSGPRTSPHLEIYDDYRE